ncbi:hypothetical protein ACAX43_09740 [Paraburkholderia sp. IW21]|uniref:hypothetical protein n=1 Tax=Paraburkholderia sp. IW21 TaxID=3242488 RepID=UPI0035216436
MPDDMKENTQAIRLSPIALLAVHGALVYIRIRATASADSIPIAGLTRHHPNPITHPCCLYRGEQGIRLVGAGAYPRAPS